MQICSYPIFSLLRPTIYAPNTKTCHSLSKSNLFDKNRQSMYTNIVTYFEFIQHFQTRRWVNCYVVSGDDSYFVTSVTRLFCSAIQDFKDINIVRFDDFEIDQLLDECQTLPFGSDYKIIISNKEFKAVENDKLKKYLKKQNEQIILLLLGTKLKLSGANILEIDCVRADDRQLSILINEIVQEADGKIDSNAISTLTEYCDRHMQRIDSELKKLLAYKQKDKITTQDIHLLVVPSLEYKVFALSEAVGKRDSDQAFKIYNALMDSGEDNIALNGVLYAHYRRLFLCSISKHSKDDKAKYLGVKPYSITLAESAAKLYKAKDLKNICAAFWKIDLDIRQGKITTQQSTQKLMLEILTRT